MTKKKRKSKLTKPPDVILAVRVIRRIRHDIANNCPAAVLCGDLANESPLLPEGCSCRSGDSCLDCRHCREGIIRELSRVLR